MKKIIFKDELDYSCYLQRMYRMWRYECDCLEQSSDCGDINNRRDFSNYAFLYEEISFDDMLELEHFYDGLF